MAGTDTVRGIDFQHAAAMEQALDLLDDAQLGELWLERGDDLIDLELRSITGERVRSAQAKSLIEGYSWQPAAIIEMLKRWAQIDAPPGAPFVFISNGPASPATVRELRPRLNRLRQRAETEEDIEALEQAGLEAQARERLRAVTLSTTYGDAGALTHRIEHRVIELRELHAPVGLREAQAIVDRLYVTIARRAGDHDPEQRKLTRAEMAELIGVPLEVLDGARGWAPEQRDAYRSAILAEPPEPVPIELLADELHGQAALELGVFDRDREDGHAIAAPVSSLLDLDADSALTGPPGAGKTTALRLLLHEATERGATAIGVPVAGYSADRLRLLIRRAVERAVDVRLAPGAVETLLSEGPLLLLDGISELPPDQRDALVTDLQRLRQDHPAVRLVVTGRDPARLRAISERIFELNRLGWEQREQLAALIVRDEKEARRLARALHDRLGTVVENPLLFALAIHEARTGAVPESRAEIYRLFVDRLRARAGNPEQAAQVVLAIALACVDLAEEEQYAADDYWWLSTIEEAISSLSERGLSSEGLTAADALGMATEIGLLHVDPLSAQRRLLHDSFRDYLAALGFTRELATLRLLPAQAFEEIADFIAELAGVGRELARLSCELSPVAAARVAVHDRGTPHEQQLEDAQALLASLFAHGSGRAAELAGDSFTLLGWIGVERGYFLLRSGPGESNLVDQTAFEEEVRSALLVISIQPDAGDLAIAVSIWLEMLRRSLDEALAGVPLSVPAQREALPEAVIAAFRGRREALVTLTERLLPTLAPRILDEIGWRGLHAEIEPAQSYQTPWGDSFEEHPLRYSYASDDVSCELADEPRDDFRAAAQRTTVEHYLHEEPQAAAQKALNETLARLLPGWRLA